MRQSCKRRCLYCDAAVDAAPQMQKDDSKLSSFLLPLAYTKGGNAGISP